MKKYVFLILGVGIFTGCTSYQINSSPQGAKIHYKGNIVYKPWIPQRTPIKVRKGIEWPYGYNYVRVVWDDGESSDWKLLDRDLNVSKTESGEGPDLQLGSGALTINSMAAPPVVLSRQ